MNENFVVLECKVLVKNYHYARIHEASCGFAREPNHRTGSTFCHGYFDTFLEALEFAKSLGTKSVYECDNCSPRHAYKRVARARKERDMR